MSKEEQFKQLIDKTPKNGSYWKMVYRERARGYALAKQDELNWLKEVFPVRVVDEYTMKISNREEQLNAVIKLAKEKRLQ